MSKRVSYPETRRVDAGTVLVSETGVLYVVTPASSLSSSYSSKAVELVFKSDWLAWKQQEAVDLASEIARLEGKDVDSPAGVHYKYG
jgi:hypothetical protein